MNKFFLISMMFVGAQSECMELCVLQKSEQQPLEFIEDIVQKVIFPYLSLQSIARFGRTCKKYEKIFEPGKIEYMVAGLEDVKTDYHRCTQALGRFAQHKNVRMFKCMWCFDASIRKDNLALLEQKSNLNFCNEMNAYCTYYGNSEDVEKNIDEQLRNAIMKKKNRVIDRIVKNKKYNIFELFNNETLETAFATLCSIKEYFISIPNILALLPVEDGEYKNRAVQYIAKYDELCVLLGLLRKEYLKVDEEYGHKCTLLHYAALRGCRALTDKLLKRGADVHAVNAWGKQPLYYASWFEQAYEKFDNIYLFRGEGVVRQLEDWCYQKHIRPQEITQKCGSVYQPWDVSEEEATWLRNSCTYSLEEIEVKK